MNTIIENENIKIILSGFISRWDDGNKLNIKKFILKKINREFKYTNEFSAYLDEILKGITIKKLQEYINKNMFDSNILTIKNIKTYLNFDSLKEIKYKNQEGRCTIDFNKEVCEFRDLIFDLNKLEFKSLDNYNLINFLHINQINYLIDAIMNDNRFENNNMVIVAKELIRLKEFKNNKKTLTFITKDNKQHKIENIYFNIDGYDKTFNIGKINIFDIDCIKYNRIEFRFEKKVLELLSNIIDEELKK